MTDNLTQYVDAFNPITSRVRTDKTAIKKKNGKSAWTRTPLTDDNLIKHLSGGKPRGVCPIKAGESTTRLALLDLDSHKGEIPWDDMIQVAKKIKTKAEENGLYFNLFRSFGGKGIHMVAIWNEPQDAYSIRMFLMNILTECGYKNGTRGIANNQIEVFPKQNQVPISGHGNQCILPLAGNSLPIDAETFEIMEKEYFLNMTWPLSTSVPQLEQPTKEVATKVELEDRDIKMLPNMLKHIDPEDYDTWTKVGMALHNVFAGSASGMEIWQEWSKAAPNYKNREEIEYKWGTFAGYKGNQVSIGTIRKLAGDGGWIEDVSDMFDPEAFNFEDDRNTLRRFELIQAANFSKQNNVNWLIKYFFPKVGLAMVYGESGSGKSFIVMDLCLSIARGVDWNGHKIKSPHRVVYIAAEGVVGVGNRLKAYSKFYGIELKEIPFYVMNDSPNLHEKEDEQLIKSIQDQGGADVVVIDTLAQTTSGANENSGEDMGKIMKRCQNIMNKLPCLVIVIHHSGKDLSRGSRGWSGMKAAVDTEIVVTRSAFESCAAISKQKDGEAGKEFPFSLESVVIGQDEDGDDITSCIVKHLEKSTASALKITGKWQKHLIDAHKDLRFDINDAVAQDALIQNAITLACDDPLEKPTDIRKSTITRALDSLIDKGLLISDFDGIRLSHNVAQIA